jgi:hypothetical protein
MSAATADTEKRGPGQSRLSPAELSQRGRLAIAARNGRDVRGLRLRFDELKASRELAEAAERLVLARVGQGLPVKISDPGVLAKIAALLADVGPNGSAPQTKKVKAAIGEQSVAAREASDVARNNPRQA